MDGGDPDAVGERRRCARTALPPEPEPEDEEEEEALASEVVAATEARRE
jgi:hypothetical protein